ncbi:8816_t:CDS:2, partial [Funneliformis mosseae]
SKLAVAATHIIRDVLHTSLLNFAQSLAEISGFFSILQNELSILARNSDASITKLHYYKCRNKVPAIVAACQFYMKSIPDCQTELLCIPNDCDKNYVQQWLIEKKAKIGNVHLSEALTHSNPYDDDYYDNDDNDDNDDHYDDNDSFGSDN